MLHNCILILDHSRYIFKIYKELNCTKLVVPHLFKQTSFTFCHKKQISSHNKRYNCSHPNQPKSNFTHTDIHTIKLLPVEISVIINLKAKLWHQCINTHEFELWQLGWEQLLQKAHHNMLIISGIVQNTVKFQNANFYHFLAKIVQSLLRFTNGYTYNVVEISNWQKTCFIIDKKIIFLSLTL